MRDLYTAWRAVPLLTRVLTALPILVLSVLALAAVLPMLLAWVACKAADHRSAGEAVADEAEAGADEAEARAAELGEDLDPARADDDAERSGLAALAQREAGARYDAHDGLHGLDPFGGE